MVELNESQRKTVATGLTILSVTVVGAFVAFVGWLALKALAYVSSAIIPVISGLFLALFFKPYYGWWKRLVKNPSGAAALMMLSVLVPVGFFLWHFGAFAADQISNLVTQAPELAAKGVDWLHANFPKARELADKINGFLASLDPQSRVMFVKRYYYSESVFDIARLYGIGEHAVSVRLFRIRKKLKKYLIKEGVFM